MARIQANEAVWRSDESNFVKIFPGSSILITDLDDVPSDVWNSRTGGSVVANPVTADSFGRISSDGLPVYLEQGTYKYTIYGDDFTSYTIEVDLVSAEVIGEFYFSGNEEIGTNLSFRAAGIDVGAPPSQAGVHIDAAGYVEGTAGDEDDMVLGGRVAGEPYDRVQIAPSGIRFGDGTSPPADSIHFTGGGSYAASVPGTLNVDGSLYFDDDSGSFLLWGDGNIAINMDGTPGPGYVGLHITRDYVEKGLFCSIESAGALLTGSAAGDIVIRNQDSAKRILFGAGSSGAVPALEIGAAKLGFFNTSPITKPAVTGSRGANAALASLLTQLASLGLVTDSSSA